MNININDKFITVNPLWFIDEGTIIAVTNISEDGIISFTFGENNSSNGYMDYSTFSNHFKKIEEKPVATTVPTVTEEEIVNIISDIVDNIMENSEFEIHNAFGNCTTVYCHLPNGYTITESCANVNYDAELAEEVCHDKIWDKIWELESYRFQQWLYENEHHCGDCENCPCDGEGCEDEIEVEVEVETETDIEIEIEEECPCECDNCSECIHSVTPCDSKYFCH